MPNLPQKKFTWQSRIKSFYYAFKGIRYMVLTQHNAWIHLFMAFWVSGFGLWFGLTWAEWCWLVLSMGFVLVSEAFNTAIEVLVDLVAPDYHPLAEIVKDVASGAVLLAAISSAIIGFIIFGPRFFGANRD